jgi:hypothetical protein
MITREENQDLRMILARVMQAQVEDNLKEFALQLVVLDEYLELITEQEEEEEQEVEGNVTPFKRPTKH